MPYIIFMFKIDNNPTIYNGKICLEYLSDDYDYGLDLQIKNIVIKCMNTINIEYQNIYLGVCNILHDDYFFSNEEALFFDLYVLNNSEFIFRGKKYTIISDNEDSE